MYNSTKCLWLSFLEVLRRERRHKKKSRSYSEAFLAKNSVWWRAEFQSKFETEPRNSPLVEINSALFLPVLGVTLLRQRPQTQVGIGEWQNPRTNFTSVFFLHNAKRRASFENSNILGNQLKKKPGSIRRVRLYFAPPPDIVLPGTLTNKARHLTAVSSHLNFLFMDMCSANFTKFMNCFMFLTSLMACKSSVLFLHCLLQSK